MDGRKNNSGKIGNKGGRPPKVEEQKLIERLTPLQDKAFTALEKAIDSEQNWAVKLWFEYMYGKPKEKVEITKVKEQPLFGDE
jgi:hypothetical protein